MNHQQPLSYDRERNPAQWADHVRGHDDLPVLDRAYRAVVVLLASSGLRGLNDVKTAEIARLAGVNESTLFRYVRKRDQLVADAIDWCWQQVNQRIAAAHHRTPRIGSTARELLMADLEAFLDLFDDESGQLVGTGAMLSFRRAEQLTDGFECPAQLAYRERLELLASALPSGDRGVGLGDGGGAHPELDVIATYLTNFLSTVWFSWLADPSSRRPDGILSRKRVRRQLVQILESFVDDDIDDDDIDDDTLAAGSDDGVGRSLWVLPGA